VWAKIYGRFNICTKKANKSSSMIDFRRCYSCEDMENNCIFMNIIHEEISCSIDYEDYAQHDERRKVCYMRKLPDSNDPPMFDYVRYFLYIELDPDFMKKFCSEKYDGNLRL
jgi:hypothetical protein